MEDYQEISLKNFEFHGYAKQVADEMSDEELEAIEQWMEETGYEWDEDEINDLFAFHCDFFEKRGYESINYETLLAYDEYCKECNYEGLTPRDFWNWFCKVE